MKAFTQIDGLVCPLDRANVDTDAIIPKQFLKSIKRSGFGPNLFDEWRYFDRGEPGDGRGRGDRRALRRCACALIIHDGSDMRSSPYHTTPAPAAPPRLVRGGEWFLSRALRAH